MEKIEKVLASGNSHATVNRDPDVQRGEFGVLDLKLSAPGLESLEFIATELHPRAEQLFSGAWSACYTIVFGIAASLKKVTLPPDYSVDIQVNIRETGAAWFLGAQFTIRVPGLEKEVVEHHPQEALKCPVCRGIVTSRVSGCSQIRGQLQSRYSVGVAPDA